MRLTTIAEYEAFVYGLRDAFSSVLSSTLRIIRTGPASGRLVGILTFSDHLRLDVAEFPPTSSITASLRPNSRSPGLTCRS